MPDYFPILFREKKGCFDVPMIHSTYLIDLRQKITDNLFYLPAKDYNGELDDILVFAYSARLAGRLRFFVFDPFHRPYSTNRNLQLIFPCIG